jgi:hypothetical protein
LAEPTPGRSPDSVTRQEDIRTVQIAVVGAPEIGYNSYHPSSLGPVAAEPSGNLVAAQPNEPKRLRYPNEPDVTGNPNEPKRAAPTGRTQHLC